MPSRFLAASHLIVLPLLPLRLAYKAACLPDERQSEVYDHEEEDGSQGEPAHSDGCLPLCVVVEVSFRDGVCLLQCSCQTPRSQVGRINACGSRRL